MRLHTILFNNSCLKRSYMDVGLNCSSQDGETQGPVLKCEPQKRDLYHSHFRTIPLWLHLGCGLQCRQPGQVVQGSLPKAVLKAVAISTDASILGAGLPKQLKIRQFMCLPSICPPTAQCANLDNHSMLISAHAST